MNNNYLIYNNLGILVWSKLGEISQGNHNMDYFYIGYEGYDYTKCYLTIATTLPDGTNLPELLASMKDFDYNDSKFKGFMFKLSEGLTSQAGNLTFTFILKSVEDDTQLCSSQLNLTIHATDNYIEPTITNLQYNELAETIRENFASIDEKIENGQLKGDKGDKGDSGTVTIGATITGETGTPAIVENVGTPTDAILNFTIPRGEKGEKGDKGDSGTSISKTSELINDGDGKSPFATETETANKLETNINHENYILTLKLLNKNGTVIDTKYIDFPIESMVVNARYDAEKKEIILVLKNGTELPLNIEELVSGLVDEKSFEDIVENRNTISNWNGGGAIGYNSKAGSGFAGGSNAQTIDGDATIDAIQMGTGTNSLPKTMQVYDDNIYDANTHTAKLQKVALNGQDLQGLLDKKQNKLTIDSSLNIASGNPIMNAAVTGELNKKLDASSYVVDTQLSSTSNNPIANSVVTGINADVQNKPNAWLVAHDVESFIDQDKLLWISLKNNQGEEISRQIVDLKQTGFVTEDYVDEKTSKVKDDIAIASSNTKYAISPNPTEISVLNEYLSKTTNSTVRMRGCAYGNGIYVITGTSGALQYSTDNAETWSIIPAFTTNVIVSIAYGGGIFICVDSAGGIFKSRNCIDWEQLSSPITDIINAIVYVNGKFALVGANGLIAFSNDATNFNVVSSGVTNELTSITRGLDKYVAVSTSGDILVSINGIDWENKSVDTTHYRTATFGKNIFVIGGQGGKIKYSTDAINWIDATNDSTSSVNYIRDIRYANGKFYAVMYISTGQG